MTSLDHQNIEVLAYHLYLGEGRSEGLALKYWFEAKEQLCTNLFRDEDAQTTKTIGQSSPNPRA